MNFLFHRFDRRARVSTGVVPFRSLLLTGLVWLLSIQPSLANDGIAAADISDTTNVYRLGKVIEVRSKRPTFNPSKIELSAGAIKTSGAPTVSSALATVPGVVVTTGSKGEAKMQIRGFTSQEVLVLYDGRPISLPYYGDLDLTTIPLSNVSELAVIKGPVPSDYGANTLGGVLNIVSRRVDGPLFAEAQIAGGSEKSNEVLVNHGARRGRLDYWVSLGRTQADGYPLSDDFTPVPLEDGGRRDKADYRRFNVDGKLDYTLPGGTLLSVSTGFYDAERHVPSGTDRPVYQFFPLWRRWYIDAGSDGRWGERVYWRGKLYYDDNENRLQRYSDPLMVDSNLVFDSYHDGYDLGGNFSTTITVNDRVTNVNGAAFRIDGVSMQGNLGEPWENASVTTGLLFDQFNIIASKNVLIDAGAAFSRMNADSIDASGTALDPYGGVTVSPWTMLSLRAAVGVSTRFPSMNHLYSSTSGNPDLKPERAIKYEVGYRLEPLSWLALVQSAFYYDVEDLIDRESKNSPYENIDEVTLKGLETGLTVNDMKGFTLFLNHAYLDAWEEPPSGSVEPRRQRAYAPRQKVDYLLCWRARFGLEIAHSGQYIGNRVDSDERAMPDYYLAHLKAAQSIGRHMKLFISVRNVFDRNYEEERYYPMAGRTIIAGGEYRY
jgi:iron complex outermembrane recepter protein